MKRISMLVVITSLVALNSVFAAVPEKAIFRDQIKMALDTKLPMSARWSAVMKSFESAQGGVEMKQLEQLYTHKDWYIRNASLIAIDRKDSKKAIEVAKKAIKDRALVIRSAAAEILMKSATPETIAVLKEELNQPYNFRGKQSLWIRGQVMGFLVENKDRLDRDFFVQSLFDKDSNIANLAVQALESKTGEIIPETDLKKKLSLWQNRVKENKWL